MKYYESKYTGAEVDALLDKVESGDVGGKVTVDSALSTESENPVMNKAVTEELGKKATKEEVSSLSTVVGEELNTLNESILENGEKISLLDANKADTSGRYPEMSVGTADDLAGRGESVPASFGFRASGGKSIKDGRAYIKRIKGNSVVWNQFISQTSGEQSTETNYIIAILNNTKDLYNKKIRIKFKASFIGNTEETSTLYVQANNQVIKSYAYAETISDEFIATVTKDASNWKGVRLYLTSCTNGSSMQYEITANDLTQMFRAGNEPTTIEEFNARVATLGIDLNAYNEGQVIHCNTESIKSVGDNAWDEEWENGTFNTTTGDNMNTNIANKSIRSKNLIPIKGGEAYYCNEEMWIILYDLEKKVIPLPNVTATISGNSFYVVKQNFILPKNAAYMRFYLLTTYGTTYNHDIMISLVHSGWKQDTDAGYQPYWQDILPLPIIRKYFPDGMKSAGSAHDEIRFNKASGKWEYSKGKIKSVDLGTLNYSHTDVSESYPLGYFRSTITDKAKGSNMICSKYETVLGWATRGIRGGDVVEVFYVKDGDYTDATTFKAAMQGVILYYESNDWEWVELDAEDQNFRDYYNVADFGTEEAIPATDAEGNIIPSAPFSADIIYQFNAVDMIREHEIEITELQQVIATMQAQLASLTSNNE